MLILAELEVPQQSLHLCLQYFFFSPACSSNIYTGIVVAATCNCAVTTTSLNCQHFQLNESIVNVAILSRGVCDFEMYSTTDYPPTQTCSVTRNRLAEGKHKSLKLVSN